MAQGADTEPRKAASQTRSRITVDLIIEATARILMRDGFDRASTNRIAREAGVSVGSLYQYFPTKEAIVAAVIDRHMEELMAVLRDAFVTVADRPVQEGARALVTVMIDAHRVDPGLHRVLVEQTPRMDRLTHLEGYDGEAVVLVKSYLDAHRDELGVTDLDLAAFICVRSVEALTHGAVLHTPEMLIGDRGDRFVDEVSRLVLGYLKGSVQDMPMVA